MKYEYVILMEWNREEKTGVHGKKPFSVSIFLPKSSTRTNWVRMRVSVLKGWRITAEVIYENVTRLFIIYVMCQILFVLPCQLEWPNGKMSSLKDMAHLKRTQNFGSLNLRQKTSGGMGIVRTVFVIRYARTPPVDERVQLRDTYNQSKKSMGFIQQGSFTNSWKLLT